MNTTIPVVDIFMFFFGEKNNLFIFLYFTDSFKSILLWKRNIQEKTPGKLFKFGNKTCKTSYSVYVYIFNELMKTRQCPFKNCKVLF